MMIRETPEQSILATRMGIDAMHQEILLLRQLAKQQQEHIEKLKKDGVDNREFIGMLERDLKQERILVDALRLQASTSSSLANTLAKSLNDLEEQHAKFTGLEMTKHDG